VPSDPRFLVSIVIPVLNDFERLTKCLRALEAQTWDTSALEVIVVDNGSDGDLAQLIAPFDFVRLARESRPGSYAARNAGLELVTGNVIAFTDSDCLPEPNWVEQGVAAVQTHGPNVVVGGHVVLFPKDADRPSLAESFELAVGFSQQLYVEQKHYAVTANLFTTPHVFAKVGRFDGSLKSGGDKEWGTRAFRDGVKVVYDENTVVRHPARRSMQELLHKRARVVGGHLAIMRERYPNWLAFSILLGRSCLPPVRRIARSSARSKKVPARQRGLKKALTVALVGASLQAFSAFELVRLQLGKPPVR
jgi:glycosyltransferase involved in cell wall biosynthesis